MSFHSALYRGELMHARHDSIAKRTFSYPVYMASLDLEELPALHRDLRLFSYRRTNLFSFDDRDYAATLSPSTRDVASHAPSDPNKSSLFDALASLRAANGIAQPATTRLVTNLRVAGYVFNPVSFFLDYDAKGALSSVIAEVNNTYGGRLRYVLGPRERIGDQSSRATQHIAKPQPIANGRVGFRHVRELFVSPFLHGEATYDFWFDAPIDDDRIAIEMHVRQPDREKGSDISRSSGDHARSFTAQFTGTRATMSDRTLAAAALRYPLMTAQVIGLIHYEAIKMRIAGVPYRRPGADHRPLAADHRPLAAE
jgi:DUF1365 family protein